MKNNYLNINEIISFINNKVKYNNYEFDEISKNFNKYFLNLYKNYFKKYKNYDNNIIYKIRDYAILNGGKRLRPLLMFITSYCINDKNIKDLEPFMLSIELIHTYSLIHDDLPCMDNDRIRRGKPSVWAKFGEDLGVLSGDAILTDAFKVIFDSKNNIKNKNKNIINKAYSLSEAASSLKLINGQVLDINNTYKNNFTSNKIIELYKNKTGALFGCATEIASLNVKNNIKFNNDMKHIGEMLGISFQIQDDILEIYDKNLNKPKNSDIKNKKNTYVAKLGLDKSKNKIKQYKISIYELIDKYIKDKNKNVFYKEFIEYIIKY